MTWSTDTMAHGNQQNKRPHSFRKSFMTCRPSKRHHIVLRNKSKSKARTLNFLQRRYTLRSNSSFTVDKSKSEDEDVEIGTDQGNYETNSCGQRTPFKNKKKNSSPPCGSETGPKILHHQVGRSSEPSEALPSCEDLTNSLHTHPANTEDEDEETGTQKCTIVRNSWGRTPFKNKKRILFPPCSRESFLHVAKSGELSETPPSCEDFTNPPHIHSADANLKPCVNQENLNSVHMDGCMNDTKTETNGLRPEATISDLCYNFESKRGDDNAAAGPEPCLLEEDTRKGTSTLSNSTMHEVLVTVPETYILEGKSTIISQPNCRGSFSESDSKENKRYQMGRYLVKRSSTMQQHSRRRNNSSSKKASVIGFDVSGTLDTGVVHPSFSGIYVNVDVIDATLRSKGISSSQCDTLPQDSNMDISKAHKASTCSEGNTSSSSEVSSVSGNTNMTHPHLCPTNNSIPPLYACRRHHRDRPIRAQIFRRPRKILVLGDMMSGKSNLISAYCSDKFKEDYIPTIVRCLQTDAEVFGERINLVVVEISGRDDFQPLRRYAYHKMDAAIICYSVDTISSLERVRNYWVPELRKHAPKAPFVVVGTKRDIRDVARDRVEEHKQKLRGESKDVEMAGRLSIEAAFVNQFVSHDRGKRLSNDVGAASFYECCSVYRDGTRNVFEGVAKIALQKSRRKRKMSSRHVDSMCTII